MCKLCGIAYSSVAVIGATSSSLQGPTLQNNTVAEQTVRHHLAELHVLSSELQSLGAPVAETPSWYRQSSSGAAVRRTAPNQRVVTYTISTKGATSSNLQEFSRQVAETLNDRRGWSQLGVSFQEVSSGGQFDLILSQAELLPTFSAGCSADWSCRVGKAVIVNDARWRGATDAWNASGGSMRDYRHMVVNHEVGHWLGHGHRNCVQAGAPAAVMQQQSIDLQGCVFNPWPLADELWSTTLGVR